MSVFLHLLTPGAGPAGESEGRAGSAEPTNGAAGKQLQGVGALALPVGQKTPGRLTFHLFKSNCSCFFATPDSELSGFFFCLLLQMGSKVSGKSCESLY